MSSNGSDRNFVIRQHTGFVYLVEFTTGTLKVGKSRDAEKRIRRYRYSARQLGNDVASWWISPRHTTFADNEQNLISFCLKRYGPPLQGRESFVGAQFSAVLRYAEGLPYPEITEAEVATLLNAYKQAAALGTRQFESKAYAELQIEMELIRSLANDLNRAASSEAAYQVARKVTSLVEAPWSRSEPDAAARYLAAKGRAGSAVDAADAREFELASRSLFALAHARMPNSFSELIGFIESLTCT